MATLYSFTVALMHDRLGLAMALGFSMGLWALAALPLRTMVKRLTAAGGLLVLIWLVVPFTDPGDPLLRIGPLAAGRTGVDLCIQISLKVPAILLALTALVATMDLATLGRTLHRLGAPAKLVHLLLLAYRYIFVLEQEYQRLHRAARMRNFRPATNLHTYKTYAYLIGMLFVRASERAERVYQAMRCRGFNGRFYTLQRFPRTRWNPVLALGITLFTGLLIGWEWWA
jgi:cobalt/nickel transport system permease protein